MGWSSGTELMQDVIKTLKAEVSDPKTRQRVYKGIINAFENADCDTLNECEGEDEAFDKALTSIHR